MPSPLARFLACVLAISPISSSNAFILPKHAFISRSGRAATTASSSKLRMARSSRSASSKEDDVTKTIRVIMGHVEKEEGRQKASKKQGMFVKEQNKFEDVTRLLKQSGAILLRSKRSKKNPVASEEMAKMNTKESSVHKDESQDESPPSTIDSDEVISSSQSKSILDDILSKLTSLFPVFVFSSALLGIQKPSALMWVNKGQIIPFMLSAVMMAMGMTLKTEDFTRLLNNKISSTHNDNVETSLAAIPAGISCQYIIMPLSAFFIGSATLLPKSPTAFLGLVLVGCSPGGTASNLVALIAKADVALSVILTSVSTLMASVLTPLLVKTLVGSAVSISGWTLCKATAQVVLLPVALGMLINEKLPGLADVVGRFASFAGVVLVSLLCGGVVAQNAVIAIENSSNILWKIMISVLGLHCVGFSVGYLASKKLFGLPERVARTISIETGMQNSALAVVLARSVMSSDPSQAAIVGLACLPGALSATAHSCLGSALAVFWRWIDNRRSRST